MSLATRCPACGTIFRVVQDQLKVSEGWVRCGQCHEVFHGVEALFDMDTDPALAGRRTARVVPPAPPPARVFAGSRPLPDSFAPASDLPESPADDASHAPSPLPAWRDVLRPQLPAIEPGTSFPPIGHASTGDSPAPPSSPTGFTPATHATPTNPLAPATRPPEIPRGTIAPRFAARLAEESARLRGTASTFDADSQLEPPPPPAEPVEPDPADFAHVVPAPEVVTSFDLPGVADEASEPEPIEATTAASPPQDAPDFTPAPFDDAGHGETAVSPPARQPRTILLKTPEHDGREDAEADDSQPVTPSSQLRADPGATTLPSLLFDEDDDDERAGPPTLASMLPEDAGEWPPRPRKARRSSAGLSTALVVVPRKDDPRFLREAQRSARWSRPGTRAALGVALALLVGGAIAQLAWPQRDILAARFPATAPAWGWLCEQAGCRIEAPRAIASLALDGSSLTRTDVDHVLLFSADLHNRADHAVRMPSFDLTFMDLNGAVVARKVLAPAQIGIRQDALAPEAELHVHARIQVGKIDASGFQAEMFYP